MTCFRYVLALIGGAALLAGQAQAQTIRDLSSQRNTTAIRSLFKPAVKLPSASTVRVRADGKDAALGAVVAADGWVVTKFDEIRDGKKITCKFKDGRELEAKVVGVHNPNDLALLKVDAKGLSPIEWSESKSAVVGNWVVTPGPSDEPLTFGVVSVATRAISAGEYPPQPLPENAGFLGVGLENGDGGPKINMVHKESAAGKAGVKVNDIVLTISGRKAKDPDTMIAMLKEFKAGDSVTLKIKREEEELEIKAVLGKRPAEFVDRAVFQNSLGKKISRRNGGFPKALQHDTILQATDCGGPLVDLEGKAVGLNISSAGRVDSYAIPSEVVKSLIPDLMAGKFPPPKQEPKAKVEPKK